jgi:hypothetical protein
MNSQDSKRHRKNFAIGLAVIGGFIAIASFSSTYSINLESFADWSGKAARALALFSSIGIEVMFCLVIYAIGYALVGFWEKTLGVSSLGFLLFTMATNYVIHRQLVKGIALSEWQQSYYDWAGALSLFGVLLLIVLFGAVSHEARDRRQQREIESLVQRRALEWKKEIVESDAFIDSLNPHKQQIFEQVKRQLQLPPAQPSRPRPNMEPIAQDYDPKDDRR